ncbi:Piwi-domain-containing protein [Calocera cornea HHB12733]|uniref:Piwi-domain-containing protein n=1 Tax=Calocera cornea HHB12733 TaxID=1353952 RepID=A0A165J2G4_9BASI|nr:Piwi-domain-containing protein [Calocera cornea HHB12733]
MLNALNLIFRQAPMQKLPHTAKSYFLPQQQREVSKDISLFLGLFQSVRPAMNRLFVNVNLTAGKFWNPRPVMDVVMEFFQARDVRRLSNMSPRELRDVTKYLHGVKVVSNHRKEPSPPRGIMAIIREGADTYQLDDTGETVLDYFWRVYQYQLKFPSACCVRISAKVVFPLETCVIVPNQFYKHELGPQFRDAMLNFTSRRPEERLAAIMNNVHELGYAESDYMRTAGLGVTMQPIKLKASVIPSPQVMYANNRTARIDNGGWNTRDDVFWRPASFRSWVWMSTAQDRQFSFQQISRVRDMLSDAMRRRGMKIPLEPAPIFQVNGQALERELRRIYQEAQQRLGGLDCIVLITDRSSDLYYTLKHFGDVQVGVATQHLDFRKLAKVNDQMCANIAMKLNPKLGGMNHVPSKASAGWLNEAPTMIFGADTSHPGPEDREKPTIAAVVSSVDETGTRYRATVGVQPSRVEIIGDLKQMVVNAIKAFQGYQASVEKRLNVVPTRVLFYRDGVGEGQFQEVCDQEVVAVKNAFESLNMKPPRVTFVVVGKRHHTRFFPVEKRDADRSGNAPSGLIVDHDIVHPAYPNWFLLSQGGLKGTSRPMHACIMKDENNFRLQALQSLTYTLTHNFARATRAVSIPSPIYYAHIASGRRAIHFKALNDGSSTISSADMTYADYERAWQGIHANLENKQYFM